MVTELGSHFSTASPPIGSIRRKEESIVSGYFLLSTTRSVDGTVSVHNGTEDPSYCCAVPLPLGPGCWLVCMQVKMLRLGIRL